jgi:hypothetical protein
MPVTTLQQAPNALANSVANPLANALANPLDRRTFISTTALLSVAVALPSVGHAAANVSQAKAASGGGTKLTAYLNIQADGSVIF